MGFDTQIPMKVNMRNTFQFNLVSGCTAALQGAAQVRILALQIFKAGNIKTQSFTTGKCTYKISSL